MRSMVRYICWFISCSSESCSGPFFPLLIFQESDASACRRKLEETIARVHRLLGERLHFPLSYLCGGFCEDLDELSELFDRAVSLLDDEPVVKSGSVTFYDASQARRTHTAVFPQYQDSGTLQLMHGLGVKPFAIACIVDQQHGISMMPARPGGRTPPYSLSRQSRG